MWACAVVGVLVGLCWGVMSSRLQHCQKLDTEGPHSGRGVIHMIYSMERKCVLCYKEVNKLLTLKSRMAKYGHDVAVSVGMNKQPTSNHRRRLPPELIVDVTQVWRKLGKKNGHIFIFDNGQFDDFRCGKLAYQVITPWSKQLYPFTGMAALSAIFDDPCGECNITSQASLDPLSVNAIHPISGMHSNKKTSRDEEQDGGDMRLKDSKIPLTIIYRSRHDHIVNGQTISFDVVELRSNDPKYHGHAEASVTNRYNISTADTNTPNATANIEGRGVTDSPTREKTTATPTEYYDDYSDDVESSSLESPMDQNDTQQLLKHYEPLMKWMSCAQQIMGS